MIKIFFQKQNSTKSGFTLVEMIVVMALLFIMTYVSMANYNQFGREVELENAVYELALTIRQAQFFGINRSEQFGGSTFDDPQPYGIYFNLDGTEEGISDVSFMMFIDLNSPSDRLFDKAGTTGSTCEDNLSAECIRTYEFTRSNYISDICVGADSVNCNPVSTLGSGARELHISFKRPDPDAVIMHDSSVTPYSYARITVSSPIADIPSKSVSIGAAGLISID